MDAVERTGDSLSESLQASLERLTQEAKADMADLERHLRQDGVDTTAVSRNAGDPVDLELAFQVAPPGGRRLGPGPGGIFRWAAHRLLSGPLWPAPRRTAPCAGAVVSGPHGTGRHSALRCFTASLGRQGALKSP